MAEFSKLDTLDMISHIKDYVLENDYNSIRNLLDAVGIETGGVTPYFSDKARTTISEILTYASIRATYDELSEEVALELIERASSVINPLNFLDAMLTYIEYEPDPDVTVPAYLVHEFELIEPSAAFYPILCRLTEEEYLLAIYLIVNGKIERVSRGTLPSLLFYAYRNNILPGDVFFAYLGTCLSRIDDEFFKTQKAIADDGMEYTEEDGTDLLS